MSKIISEEKVVEALKKVVDPEIGIDVYTLGLIYGFETKGKDIYIKMTFTTPACPYAPQLVQEISDELGFVGFNEPDFEFVFHPPWEPSDEVKMMLGLL